jgi:hypothetical protein
MEQPRRRWGDEAQPMGSEAGITAEARITIVLLTWGAGLLVICVPLLQALPVVALFPAGLACVAGPSPGPVVAALAYLFYPTITVLLLCTSRRVVFWALYSVWLLVFAVNVVGFFKLLTIFAGIKG